MKAYIIGSFINPTSGEIFERVMVGAGEGNYRSNRNAADTRHRMTFVCNGLFKVNSIIRQTGDGNNPTRETFALRTHIRVGRTNNTITGIILVDSDHVNFVSRRDNGGETDITSLADVRFRPNEQAQAPAAQNGDVDIITTMEAAILAAYPRAIRLANTWKTAERRRRGGQTLQQFLHTFFEDYNENRNTIYVDNGEQQTDTSRRRSIGDIYMICKRYYEDCTLRDVLRILITALPGEFDRGFRSSYCNTIHKYVWYYDTEDPNAAMNRDQPNEYGHTYNQIVQALR